MKPRWLNEVIYSFPLFVHHLKIVRMKSCLFCDEWSM